MRTAFFLVVAIPNSGESSVSPHALRAAKTCPPANPGASHRFGGNGEPLYFPALMQFLTETVSHFSWNCSKTTALAIRIL
ncbi:hypothetical protein MPLSOD_140600 [Mesorhizobium sp. SOD10]|nr:hypothetical protein MPLSOD_140600 [Mesorhizobium sp. SOD10]